MSKVVVIGGGVAGLSAGIYAQKCGFNVTIVESHNIPGGYCTSWRRKGYLFEGGMHWLTGSSEKDDLNSVWRYVGALNDSVAIDTPEPFFEYDHEGTPIRIYRNVDTTEKHLLELSPADEKEIKRLCGYIRKVQNLSMPLTDIKGVKVTKKRKMPISMLFSALSALNVMKTLTKSTRNELIARFTHDGIKEMLRCNTSENSGILPFVFTMGTLARGDGGFPEGGSLPFAQRMAALFTSLGGTILYKTRAERVIVENNKAVGVMVRDSDLTKEPDKTETGVKRLDADAVIITTETITAESFFDIPLKSDWLDEMKAITEPTMCTFVSLGINTGLDKYPHGYGFKLKKPIRLASETHEYLSVNNYASDPVYSPEGKTAMTICIGGDSYDFWKQAKEEGRYEEEKKKIGDAVIEAIEAQLPEVSGNVEVCDVATPLTYERYCGGWKGSWMTEMTKESGMRAYPSVIKGLERVYFAGHRMMSPGGLPPAVMTGRTAVQHLCRDTETVFVSED